MFVGIGVRSGFPVGVGVGVILESGQRSSTGSCPMCGDGVGVSPKFPEGMDTDVASGFATTSGMETSKLPYCAAGPNVGVVPSAVPGPDEEECERAIEPDA